jgi:ribosome-associated translation inhibitor RaiA
MDAGPFAAIDVAAARLKRAVANRLKTRWQKRRREIVAPTFVPGDLARA